MILLLGSGYIGSALAAGLASAGVPHRVLRRADLDYADPARLRDALIATRATFLVNAAGYTGRPNVDACETNREECLRGNLVLPLRVAEACAAARVPWAHISSGCIYQGSRPDGSGFTEQDPPNFCFGAGPCSFYSGVKALAEETLARSPDTYLWRIRIPFDHHDHPRNYLSKLLAYERLLDARNSLTHLGDFVATALGFIRLRPDPGIYNMTNPGSVTTRQVCARLASTIAPGRRFVFFRDEAEFMQVAAVAPRSHCVLDSTKLTRIGLGLPHIEEALDCALLRWHHPAFALT